jgi:short-subunit dehydrogenase
MSQKIALITGATGGIGKAAAIALARKDFTIIIHGRNESHARQVCKEMKQITGNNNIEFLIADMFLSSKLSMRGLIY